MSLVIGEIASAVMLPVALGLLGFIEPCSLGSSLLFLRFVEGKSAGKQRSQALTFLLSRALFMGALGIVAAFVGEVFLDLQRGGWLVLGTLYVGLGAMYLAGRAGVLFRALGPKLAELSHKRGAVSLGMLFGLNIPACAAPLLIVLLSQAAISETGIARGFLSLALFGAALSAPLLAALWSNRVRIWVERLASMSRRAPVITGLVLMVLGGWSISQGLASS